VLPVYAASGRLRWRSADTRSGRRQPPAAGDLLRRRCSLCGIPARCLSPEIVDKQHWEPARLLVVRLESVERHARRTRSSTNAVVSVRLERASGHESPPGWARNWARDRPGTGIARAETTLGPRARAGVDTSIRVVSSAGHGGRLRRGGPAAGRGRVGKRAEAAGDAPVLDDAAVFHRPASKTLVGVVAGRRWPMHMRWSVPMIRSPTVSRRWAGTPIPTGNALASQ
jgi:hypothetical protein